MIELAEDLFDSEDDESEDSESESDSKESFKRPKLE